MIFVIQTNDEVSALDIANLLNFAHIEHTILSKQNDEAARDEKGHDTAIELLTEMMEHMKYGVLNSRYYLPRIYKVLKNDGRGINTEKDV